MKLKFNYNVPDKNTGKEYVAGETYEFEKERAKEILAVINRDTGLPFAIVVEEPEELIEVTNMTVKQLKEVAKQMKIENFENMKKEELIKAIDEATESNKTVEEVVNKIIDESNEDIDEDAE